jgi:c(7)-type cytochrome triheme protein
MTPRDISFKIPDKRATDALFSHKVHLDMDFKCAACHTKLFPYKAGQKHNTMTDMDAGKSCGGCHNGKDAFSSAGDCVKCHPGYAPGNMVFSFSDNSVSPAVFSHEYHLGMYKCEDCHTKIFPYRHGAKHTGMGAMWEGQSCGKCHNGKDAFKSDGDCDKCHVKQKPASSEKK